MPTTPAPTPDDRCPTCGATGATPCQGPAGHDTIDHPGRPKFWLANVPTELPAPDLFGGRLLDCEQCPVQLVALDDITTLEHNPDGSHTVAPARAEAAL